jgi:hypothetical protein
MADPPINPVTGKPYTFGDMNPVMGVGKTGTVTTVDVSKLPPPGPPTGGPREIPIGRLPPMTGPPSTGGAPAPVPAIGQPPVKAVARKSVMPDTAMKRPGLRKITMARGKTTGSRSRTKYRGQRKK